jgi:hypothetical protein
MHLDCASTLQHIIFAQLWHGNSADEEMQVTLLG